MAPSLPCLDQALSLSPDPVSTPYASVLFSLLPPVSVVPSRIHQSPLVKIQVGAGLKQHLLEPLHSYWLTAASPVTPENWAEGYLYEALGEEARTSTEVQFNQLNRAGSTSGKPTRILETSAIGGPE